MSPTPQQEKLQKLVESSQRMSSDAARLENRLKNLCHCTYPDTVEGHEAKLFDIDDVMAESLAITSYLSLIMMRLYSGEYSTELFELSPYRKSDFMSQVSTLQTYYKSIQYMLVERARTARSVYEYHVQKERDEEGLRS